MTNAAIQALIIKLEEWLRDGLEQLCEFRKALAETPEPIVESPAANFLAKDGKILARILKTKESLVIIPIRSLKIRIDDRAIKWLQRKPLKEIAEKHGVKFNFREENGLLRSIEVHGKLSPEVRGDIEQPTLWAFAKASERPSNTS